MTAEGGGIVVEHDLDRPGGLPPEARAAPFVYVVLRRGGRLVGRLILDERAAREDGDFLEAARASAAAAPLPTEPRTAEPVTAVIATRDRPDDLRACLTALTRLTPPPDEIVVADSASREPERVERAARDAGARCVRLDRPGLSLARNAGGAAARGAILAFLDDDCRVDGGWLAAIRCGFSDPSVEAVTGQLLPAEVATEAQVLFLRYSQMDRRGFAPRRFGPDHRESRYWPVDAWRMGSGGNLAVRAATFRRLGGFRVDLGLGTPALGGEDLYLLWQLVHGGGAVVYRPDAMAWHRHHRDLESLRRVMHGYGAGHGAFLRAARRAGAPRSTVALYRLSYAYDRAKRWLRAVAGTAGYPAWMPVREYLGSLGRTP